MTIEVLQKWFAKALRKYFFSRKTATERLRERRAKVSRKISHVSAKDRMTERLRERRAKDSRKITLFSRRMAVLFRKNIDQSSSVCFRRQMWLFNPMAYVVKETHFQRKRVTFDVSLPNKTLTFSWVLAIPVLRAPKKGSPARSWQGLNKPNLCFSLKCKLLLIMPLPVRPLSKTFSYPNFLTFWGTETTTSPKHCLSEGQVYVNKVENLFLMPAVLRPLLRAVVWQFSDPLFCWDSFCAGLQRTREAWQKTQKTFKLNSVSTGIERLSPDEIQQQLIRQKLGPYQALWWCFCS